MESSKYDWTLSGTATSLHFFSSNPFPSAKSFQFMNFSERCFMTIIYLTSDFHTNNVISRRVCLLVKMVSKTVIRPVLVILQQNINSPSFFVVQSLWILQYPRFFAWVFWTRRKCRHFELLLSPSSTLQKAALYWVLSKNSKWRRFTRWRIVGKKRRQRARLCRRS